MSCRHRFRRVVFFSLLLLLLMSSLSAVAQLKVERSGPLTLAAASDALKQAVENKGYNMHIDNWRAEFWVAKQLTTASKDVPGALYPSLSNGEFVGAVDLPQGMTDFRGQAIPAGLYTLRYQLLPQDGNHLGVSPNPDFLLAIPADSDPNPAQHYLYKKLIALSGKTTAIEHPAVIALDTAAEPGTVSKDAQGTVVFSVAIPASGSETNVKLGIVIRGAAAQ